MNLEYDLFTGVASGGLGAALGAGLTYAQNNRKFRFHHRFWGFLNQTSVFVVGDMVSDVLLNTLDRALSSHLQDDTSRKALREHIVDHVQSQETSGLVGRGDFLSVVSAITTLSLMKLPKRPLIRHPNEVNEHLQDHLILIGGPDVNSLTREISPAMGCRLEAVMNPGGKNAIRDHHLNNWHTVGQTQAPGGRTIDVDYGVIARGRNPNNTKREVLLLAGAHGWGTLAACEICIAEDFQERLCEDMRRYRRGFEGLVRCESINRRRPSPSSYAIEFTRQLQPGVAAPAAPDTVISLPGHGEQPSTPRRPAAT